MSSFARVERLAARMEPRQKERATVVGEELDELSREGARRMLMQALDWEVADYIERDEDARDEGVPSIYSSARTELD